MTERDTVGLLFTAEMYGVQLDLLAARLAIREPAARATVKAIRSTDPIGQAVAAFVSAQANAAASSATMTTTMISSG